ncbi:MAG: HP0268 family nuclease [Campylobacterales bacterium]
MAKIKLARTELTENPKEVEFSKLLEDVKVSRDSIFYFDKENQHKDMMSLIKKFEKEGFKVYFREVRFGLDENDYIYELHVLEES